MSLTSFETRAAAPATVGAPVRTTAFNPGLAADEVHARLRAALDELQAAQRNAVLWFAEILSRGLYRELGYSSIHAYATEELGFSRARTFYFLKLCRSLDALPRLRESVSSGALPWTKALEVARVATPKTEEAWIEEARHTGRRELASKVARVKARARVVRQADRRQTGLPLVGTERMETVGIDGPASIPLETAVVEMPVAVTIDFTPEQYARYEALIERARKNGEKGTREELLLAALELLAGEAHSSRGNSAAREFDPATPTPAESSRLDSKADVAELHVPNHAMGSASRPRYQVVVTQCPDCGRAEAQTSRGLKPLGLPALQAILCDAHVLRNGEKNRATIPPARRREMLARDGHRCRASGCGGARFLDVHHLTPRERGGTNDPDNLITLCAGCHRMIHERKGAAG